MSFGDYFGDGRGQDWRRMATRRAGSTSRNQAAVTQAQMTSSHLLFHAEGSTNTKVGPAASHYPPLKREAEPRRKFKFSLDDRPPYKNATRRAARKKEASASNVDASLPRKQ